MDFPGLPYAILCIHVILGTIALVVGVIPMIAKKGGKAHNITGILYCLAMLGVVVTALPLAYLKSNYFLGAIAVFSFYMCFTGYRFTKLKPGKKPNFFDYSASVFTVIVACGMLYISFMALLQGGNAMFIGTILGVFGIICLLMSGSDLRRYLSKKEKGKMDWFYSHIGRMIGSYIATFTAFAVQNSPLQPSLVNWLAPTLIGTIAIVMTIRYYRKKFEG